MKKLYFLFIIIFGFIGLVNAKNIEFTFNPEGGKPVEDSLIVENNLIKLDGNFRATYDSNSYLTLNYFRGIVFSLQKENSHLINGYEWYAKDDSGKLYYYSNSKTYKAIDIANELGKNDGDLISIDLHANWEKDSEAINSMSLNKTVLTMQKGKTYKLKLTKIVPEGANTSFVTWTSSNTSVATVENGKVIAKKAGTTVIKAINSNGITASCNVEVKNEIHSVNITYNANLGKMVDPYNSLYKIKGRFIYKKGKKYVYKLVDGQEKVKLISYNKPGYINIVRRKFLAKQGFEWNTKSDGSGVGFKQGQRYKATDICPDVVNGDCDVVLYLHWIKETDKELKVTYNNNGGSGCSDSFTVKMSPSTSYGDYTELCEPTHSKYNFEGWHIGSINGPKVTKYTKITQTGNHKLVAKWYSRRGSIYFLDTKSSAESVLVRSPKGRYILLDNAGKESRDPETVCRYLIKSIKDIMIANGDGDKSISYMILSHRHSDHVGCTNIMLEDDGLPIEKIILKKYKSYKSYKTTDTISYYKDNNKIIDTLESNTYSNASPDTIKDNGDYLALKIDDMIVNIYNYKNPFEGFTCKNVFSLGMQYARMVSDEKWDQMLRDSQGNYYYYDITKPKGLQKATKSKLTNLLSQKVVTDGMYRYYYTYLGNASLCDANSMSLALLLEYKTTSGKKYAYLPSDLGNIGYGMFENVDKINNISGNITSSNLPIKLDKLTLYSGGVVSNPDPDSDAIKNDLDGENVKMPVVDLTKKTDDSGYSYYYPTEDITKKIPIEAETAIHVKQKVGDGKNILVYQPTHHIMNNDNFSVNHLGVNNNTTYFIMSGSYNPLGDTRIYPQVSYFKVSKNVKDSNHFTIPIEENVISNNAITVDFYKNGSFSVTGYYVRCPRANSLRFIKGEM